MALTTEPPARTYGSLTYDATLQSLILYGGMSESPLTGSPQPLNDTWRFSNGTWSNISDNDPPASLGAQLVFDSSTGYALLVNGLSHPGTWVLTRQGWLNVSNSVGTAPAPRAFSALVDDPTDGVVLLFGGTTNLGLSGCPGCPGVFEFNDTWAFSDSTWRELTQTGAPSPRDRALAVFDAGGGDVIVQDGFDSALGGPAPTGTYAFLANRWNQVGGSNAADTPCARFGAVADYDFSLNEVLAFGGSDSTTAPCDSQFGYQNGVWTPLDGAAFPQLPQSSGEMMTYDAADGYVLMFGAGTFSENQTWEFRGGLWTELHPTVSPPGRSWGGLAYDAADRQVVLFGGWGVTRILNDTWTFRDGTWTNVTNLSQPAPSARSSFAFGDDTTDGYLLLFGGSGPQGDFFSAENDTWSFHAGMWTNRTSTGPAPPGRDSAALADDPSDGYVLLFGGTYGCDGYCSAWVFYNDTWVYRAGLWTDLRTTSSPPERAGEILATDPNGGSVILANGEDYGSAYSDTWSYHAGAWTQLTLSAYAPADATIAFASDPMDGQIVAIMEWWWPDHATWTYQGDSVAVNISASPPTGPAPLNVTLNATVQGSPGPYSGAWLFGDGTATSGLNVTHVFEAPALYRAHLNVTTSTGNQTGADLLVSASSSLACSIAAAQTNGTGPLDDTFLGLASGGLPPYAFTWSFGDGSNSSTGTLAQHRYWFPGAYWAVLAVRDSGGNQTSSGIRVVVQSPALQLELSATNPAGDAPLSENFTVAVMGGVPPYEYLWDYGDGSTSSTADAPHTFLSPGTYNVTLTVTDARLASVSRSTFVVVFPTLRVNASVSLGAGPAPLSVPFVADISGGSGPYAAWWTFGDGTFGSFENGTHVYVGPGTYIASLRVTDAAGGVATSEPLTISAGSPLAPLRAALAITPDPVIQFSVVTVTLNISGGSAPYALTWSGLPTGCDPGQAISFSCQAAEVGVGSLAASVVDGDGQTTVARELLVVQPQAIQLDLTVRPSVATLGQTIQLSTEVFGGVPPFTFSWVAPTGCAPLTAPNVTCEGVPAGSYQIQVVGRDSAGGVAAANGTLLVTTGPTATSPPPPALTALDGFGLGLGVALVLVPITWWWLRKGRQIPPTRAEGPAPPS